MSKKISEITAGSIVWFNTTLSGSDKSTPFIVLGPSKAGDSILLLQKYVYQARKFHNTNVSEYSTSDMDKYLSADATESDSYRSKLPDIIRNCLVKTTIGSYSYNSNTTLNLTRDIFLMSHTEIGWTDSTLSAEGDSYFNALAIAAGTTYSIARSAAIESGGSVDWWLRSPGSVSTVMSVGNNGSGCITLHASEFSSCPYVRPILSVAPATRVDDSTSTPTVIGPPPKYQSTIKESDSLIINTVENESVYNNMVAAGEIKENELYFVGGTVTCEVSSVNNKTGAVTLTASDLGINIAADSDVNSMITDTLNATNLKAPASTIVMNSATPDSTKQFEFTVDDTGTLTAHEV